MFLIVRPEEDSGPKTSVYNRLLTLILLLVFCLFSPASSSAGTDPAESPGLRPVMLDNQLGAYSFGSHLQYLEDWSGALTITDVSRHDQAQWQRSEHREGRGVREGSSLPLTFEHRIFMIYTNKG